VLKLKSNQSVVAPMKQDLYFTAQADRKCCFCKFGISSWKVLDRSYDPKTMQYVTEAESLSAKELAIQPDLFETETI